MPGPLTVLCRNARRLRCLLVGLTCIGLQSHAVEFRGLVDLRIGASDAQRSWTHEGLDKTRFDRQSGNLRLGQAFLRVDGELLDSISATVVVSGNDDRARFFDINEAWLGWNPVPASSWKTRVKLGAFFPATSLEIDYDSVGWTPARTLSSSAINSWIGEELRTHGIEFSMARNGQAEGSSHDFGFNAAVFGRNDPAGTLLAWRGWTISDRITGLSEPVRLADLPVFRAGGGLPDQNRSIRLFRELDNRLGFYTGVHYAYEGWLKLEALHYDNRGEPLVLKNGQYSWKTRFDHLGVRVQPGGKWLLLVQALRGETTMGANAVQLDYRAWFALASHSLGPGNIAIRFDQFRVREKSTDILPEDPNGERGRALALAYVWPINQSISLVSEALVVRSSRVARNLIGEPSDRTERSISTAIRWRF